MGCGDSKAEKVSYISGRHFISNTDGSGYFYLGLTTSCDPVSSNNEAIVGAQLLCLDYKNDCHILLGSWGNVNGNMIIGFPRAKILCRGQFLVGILVFYTSNATQTGPFITGFHILHRDRRMRLITYDFENSWGTRVNLDDLSLNKLRSECKIFDINFVSYNRKLHGDGVTSVIFVTGTTTDPNCRKASAALYFFLIDSHSKETLAQFCTPQAYNKLGKQLKYGVYFDPNTPNNPQQAWCQQQTYNVVRRRNNTMGTNAMIGGVPLSVILAGNRYVPDDGMDDEAKNTSQNYDDNPGEGFEEPQVVDTGGTWDSGTSAPDGGDSNWGGIYDSLFIKCVSFHFRWQ